jgi:ABC-type sugar transport system ATPase subunit
MECTGLKVERLTLVRGSRAVLSDVSFTLAPGALLAVVGPSGAGKSTLLSLRAGFERPTSGAISFDGFDWRIIEPVARGVGMSFDDAALHEHLSVRDNLDLALRPLGEIASQRQARIAEIAERLGVTALLTRTPGTLSAGERRRVSLGRAFVRRPTLALLDEPFANLDRANRLAVRALVRELRQTSAVTTVMVTHDPTDALALADDLLVLVDGQVRAHGRATEVAANPADLKVAQLVDDLGMESIALVDGRVPAHCTLEPEFAATISTRLADRGLQHGFLGISPWRLTATTRSVPGATLEIRCRVAAHEPAGLFTDLVVDVGIVDTRAGNAPIGATMRARTPATDAYNLPPGTHARLTANREDIHLFGGVWPGVRID